MVKANHTHRDAAARVGALFVHDDNVILVHSLLKKGAFTFKSCAFNVAACITD